MDNEFDVNSPQGWDKLYIDNNIGWDLGEPKTSTTDWNHFYNIDLGKVTGPASGEIAQKLESTDKLHDWFVEKGIDVKLISDQSFISNKFERIQLKDIS